MQSRDLKKEAELTIAKIRNQLTYGSNNDSDRDRADFLRGHFVRAAVHIALLKNALLGNDASLPNVTKLKFLAMAKYGYGQCDEQAHAAFMDLVEKGIYLIDYCHTSKGKHCLLVVGRDPASDKNDMSTWGDNVFICDPWINRVYPLSDFQKMQHETTLGKYNEILYSEESLPPHYLSGTIIIEISVKNKKDLIKFQNDIKLHPKIVSMFASKADSIKELETDFRKLREDFDMMKKTPLFTRPELQEYIAQIQDNLTIISHRVSEEKTPETPVKSNFRGSVVTATGDAHTSLVKQLNVAIKKDSKPSDFSTIEQSVEKFNYGQAVRKLCTFKEEPERALPILNILLQFKNQLKINLDAQVGDEKYAAIHYAAVKVALHGDRSLYDLLVKQGANEALPDKHGKSAAQHLQESLTSFKSQSSKTFQA